MKGTSGVLQDFGEGLGIGISVKNTDAVGLRTESGGLFNSSKFFTVLRDGSEVEIPVAMGTPPDIGGRGAALKAVKNAKPTISAIKKALKKVYKELGIDGPLPKGKPGRFGSPTRGTGKKGYRLDPPHKDHKKFWHIDYWTGKRKAGKMDHIKIY